jgi:hypothetical protein
MAAAVVEFNSVKRGRERHLWDLVNGHKEVLWKQTEPCVALLQITSEMTATTQGRGKRGRLWKLWKKKEQEQHLDESYQTY